MTSAPLCPPVHHPRIIDCCRDDPGLGSRNGAAAAAETINSPVATRMVQDNVSAVALPRMLTHHYGRIHKEANSNRQL